MAALTLSQPFGQRSARFLLEMTDELLDESAQLGAMLPKAALFNLLSIVLSYVSYIGCMDLRRPNIVFSGIGVILQNEKRNFSSEHES